MILDDFYISKYPVTQKLYKALMGKNPSEFKDSPHNPVEQVTWFMAMNFMERVSKYTNKKYILPTEWEYAAKGGQKSKGFK